ncbi:hypothetical protein G3O08_04690 [Cryomorpha ignava]|uniref:Uncharacterized protein n=1 Tax=Cryomorpha ignava TaxID=101383 RepID=A0A7K3WMC3_9FLAO|nr:hypothetical protein [Cryomorpha ignava]
MASVDNIRNGLINKILSFQNKEFLMALDQLIASSSEESVVYELTEEQELMIQMSMDDISNGNFIDQDQLKSKTEKWLDQKKI